MKKRILISILLVGIISISTIMGTYAVIINVVSEDGVDKIVNTITIKDDIKIKVSKNAIFRPISDDITMLKVGSRVSFVGGNFITPSSVNRSEVSTISLAFRQLLLIQVKILFISLRLLWIVVFSKYSLTLSKLLKIVNVKGSKTRSNDFSAK